MNISKKKYYQKNRVPSKFFESIISIDGHTAQFITIAFISLLFLLITVGVYTGMTFEKIWTITDAEKTAPILSKKKGNTIPFEITLLQVEEKQTIAELPKEKEITENNKKEPKNQINRPTYSKPEPQKKELSKKSTPAPPQTEKPKENKPDKIEPTENFQSQELSKSSSSEFSLQSKSMETESADTANYAKKLDAQISDGINLLKPYITDQKWKYVQSSYIITLDLEEGKEPKINFVTKSANFYFNIIVERTFNNLQMPSLMSNNLKEFKRTYVITYRP